MVSRAKPVRTRPGVSIHPSADVSPQAALGEGTRVWHQAQVREGARIGRECILGKGVYVDRDVVIGNRCKLQNGASVFRGFRLESGVFVGPGVLLLNDKLPRAVTADGRLKSDADWIEAQGVVGEGASLGGGAVLLPGVRIGSWALVGAGSVVTRDVPDHAIVLGNPARLVGFACACGNRLERARTAGGAVLTRCPACGRSYSIPEATWELATSPG